jgi:hypothetical protein
VAVVFWHRLRSYRNQQRGLDRAETEV